MSCKQYGLLENKFAVEGNHLVVSLIMWVCSFQTHCYYHGTVEGIAGSTLALSTCDGLRYFPIFLIFHLLMKLKLVIVL